MSKYIVKFEGENDKTSFSLNQDIVLKAIQTDVTAIDSKLSIKLNSRIAISKDGQPDYVAEKYLVDEAPCTMICIMVRIDLLKFALQKLAIIAIIKNKKGVGLYD